MPACKKARLQIALLPLLVRLYVELVSKLQITPKNKACLDEKTQQTRAYVVSVRGSAT